MNVLDSDNRPVAFFDGGCPVCRREIAHYRRLDRTGRIRWVDIHANPEALGNHHLSWQAAMQRMHVIDAGGRLRTGVSAFATLWRHLPGYRPLAWLVSMPGLHWLLERAYTGFARWRWRRRCDGHCPAS